MPTMRLTEIVARNAEAIPGRQVTLWDSSLPGFGLRLGAGAKTWTVMLGKDRRRITLGRYPLMGMQAARFEAKRLMLANAVVRNDPRITPVTFAEALKKFIEIRIPQKRLSTGKEYERILRKHFEPQWRNRAITDIARSDVHQALDCLMDTPAMANNAFAALRLFCRWSLRRGYLLTSPCEGLETPSKLTPRDRVLNWEELKKVLRAARTDTFGTIVLLLILTAQRRSEIAGLRSEWINRDAGILILPASITKNKREHVLPITPFALNLLPRVDGVLFPARGHCDVAFNGWSKSMACLRKTCDIKDFRLHDLRRTAATRMAELGTLPHIVERILNHITGSTAHSITPLGRIYNRHLYLDEMRGALNAWERQVLKLTAG